MQSLFSFPFTVYKFASFVGYSWTYAKISRRRDFLHRVDGRYIKTTTRQLLFTTTRNQRTRKHMSVAPKPVLDLSSQLIVLADKKKQF